MIYSFHVSTYIKEPVLTANVLFDCICLISYSVHAGYLKRYQQKDKIILFVFMENDQLLNWI